VETTTPETNQAAPVPAPAAPAPAAETSGATTGAFEIDIYQICDDSLFKKNRIDGTGWDWSWADWRRDWMDATASKFAYRCLPLTIANQTGWWVYNPVGFTAVWRGNPAPGQMQILFDHDPDTWSRWINNQFGQGIITWNTPFLFKTRPAGSRLLVMGPANQFKHGVQPLTAVIETDWMSMSFTMNWKFTAANVPVRFEVGEPLFQAIPIAGNVCGDLEDARVTYAKLWESPEVSKAYHEWHNARQMFHQQKARGEVKADGWQKDYFQGRDAGGRDAAPDHMTKVKPPKIHYKSRKP
jgi:hypothetical protein